MTTMNHGQSTTQPDILKLSDTPLALTNSADDIRGRKAVDAAGEDIGHVDDLMIDAAQKKVRFLRVTTGGFLGIGKTAFLIPVDAISRIDDKLVHINHARNKFVGAPTYNPEMVDRAYLEQLYGYYDYVPFWSAGYNYPSYPRYPMSI